MASSLNIETGANDLELDAYNAAFYDLGLRWHWDGDTYDRLVQRSACPLERLRHYLRTQQEHLLKAYDADFLVGVIEARKGEHSARHAARGGHTARTFDWARSRDAEIGI